MRSIETVLFDLDDTLHDDTLAFTSAAEEVAREVEAEHGIDALELRAAYVAQSEGFWKALSREHLTTKLETTRMRLWKNALAAVGLEDEHLAHRTANNYYTYRKKYLTLFPGAIDLLRMLRARGVRLGIITNGFAETHTEKIALLQIGEFFDAIFFADAVGMLKPDPLLFAHACTRLGSAPAASAMVGDRYERDVRGAIKAGLFSVWMNVHADALPPGAPLPDATVDSIAEVASVLQPILKGSVPSTRSRPNG